MNNQNQTIKGLWVGEKLSPIEILSIKSFIKQGHSFELFVYAPVKNVPNGVVLEDAGQIIPPDRVEACFSGSKRIPMGVFSDLFRYKLLNDLGGWYSDLDVVCLKSLDFDQDYVFIQEITKGLGVNATPAVMKTPISAPIMKFCYEQVDEMFINPDPIPWGHTGPLMIDKAIGVFNLDDFRVPTGHFCPIGADEIQKMFTRAEINEEACAIHLYNEMWRRLNLSKNGIYHKNTLYSQLMTQHQIKRNFLALAQELFLDLRTHGRRKGIKIIKKKLITMIRTYHVGSGPPALLI